MSRIWVREDLVGDLERTISPIARKCIKAGISCKFEVSKNETTYKTSQTNSFEKIAYVPVDIEMKIVYSGWEVVMSLYETESGSNLITSLNPNERLSDLEKYIYGKIVCEHCGCNRRRKRAYLLRNIETTELKIVGSTCLKEFTGGLDAALTAKAFTILDTIKEIEHRSEAETIPSDKRLFNKYYVLGLGLLMFDKYGYEKSYEYGFSTAGRVRDIILNNQSEKFDIPIKRAEEILNSVKEILETKNNKNCYEYNLFQICSTDAIGVNDIGLLCSSILYYSNAKKSFTQKEDMGFYGEIGNKLEIDIKNLKSVAVDTRFGSMVINTFEDIDGYKFVWKTSKSLIIRKTIVLVNDEEVNGDVITSRIAGTIKAHTEYNGFKQTELTRCKTLGMCVLDMNGVVIPNEKIKEIR